MDIEVSKLKEKFNLAKCKAILNKGEEKYSDQDILALRDYLLQLAEIDYLVFLQVEAREKEKEGKISNQNKNDEQENNNYQQAA